MQTLKTINKNISYTFMVTCLSEKNELSLNSVCDHDAEESRH